MKKILIVKTSALGDIIHTYPALHYLRKKFPNVVIDWVVESSCADLVKSHPYVDYALCVDTKAWRKSWFSPKAFNEMRSFRKRLRETNYDVVFDLQGNVKSGLITALAKGQFKVGFSWSDVPEWPNVLFTNRRYGLEKGNNIRYDYLSLVSSFFGEVPRTIDSEISLKILPDEKQKIAKILSDTSAESRELILVCPGSVWPNKQLSEKTMIDLLTFLDNKKKCSFLFASGSQIERDYVEKLKTQVKNGICIEKLKLSTLQNLMSKCNLIIAMDSLPLHLAGTTSTSTFTVFGPSSANKYNPLGSNRMAIQGSCPYGRTFEKRCPILRTCPTGACIKDVVLDDSITCKLRDDAKL